VNRDTLFAAARDSVSGFRFDDTVARVFPDMLDRSIPGYATIIAQTGLLAARHAKPGTALYDLGCSLGASALSMRDALVRSEAGSTQGSPTGPRGKAYVIHAIDSSPAMIARARDALSAAGPMHPSRLSHPAQADHLAVASIQLHEADLVSFPLAPASVVAMNFTLQFIAAGARESLLRRIATALEPGGILILSEKIRFDDPAVDTQHREMYHAFKRANGYSELEVAQKRAALENVLVPDTLAEHEKRLCRAGFGKISVWFQCFNFVSLVAVRADRDR